MSGEISPAQANGERGTALVTVLIMLAVMSTLALAITTTTAYSLRRTANQSQMDQVRWYLFGAEAYALRRIGDLHEASASAALDQNQWQGVPFTFPLDDGVMTITLWDGSNCINLNSVTIVAENDDEDGVESSLGRAQFARLLDQTGVVFGTQDGALVQALADWIDGDGSKQPGGAEDDAYIRRSPPYRAANTLLADLSELRRVAGFTDEALTRIAPYACVRPKGASSTLNVNALRSDQALVLAAAIGNDLSEDEARRIIAARPVGGWKDIEDFFRQPALSQLELAPALRARFSLKSSYMVMTAQVRHREMVETSATLFDTSGRPFVVRRVFGVGRAGRLI